MSSVNPRTKASQSVSPSKSSKTDKKTPTKLMRDKKLGEDEFMAAAIGDTEWLRQSLRGGRGNITYDENGLAPIHLAAIHGRVECLKLLIEKFNIDVNLASHTGWRPVHLAISNQTGKRAYTCLTYLLSKGADHSVTNDDGITPMHQAASEGHVQCLKTLIEVGGVIDGRDQRNMKPIDMAKLWGHRKCARVLAAESWHREKNGLAKEIKQFEKVKMSEVLKEIERDDMTKPDQQLFGTDAYKNWARNKGHEAQSRTKPPQKEAKPLPENTTHKPNSMRTAPNVELAKPKRPATQKEEHHRKTPPSTQTPDTDLGLHERETSTRKASLSEATASRPASRKTFTNDENWNKSTKVPERPYTTDLVDYYPRDEYTNMPIYPLKKGKDHKPVPALTAHMEMYRAEDTDDVVLPADFIEKTINSASGTRRDVLFKCKNIVDAQRRKHFTSDERIPKPETALHLSDPTSGLFQSALVSSTRPTSIVVLNSNHSNTAAYTRSAAEARGVLRIMSNMNKPTTFPDIKGEHYDLYMGKA